MILRRERAHLESHETIIHNHLLGKETCTYSGSRGRIEGVLNISVLS